MKNLIISLLILPTISFALTNNEPAPNFTLPGDSGKKISLNDYKGKVVVLEWLNHGCPFVKKHYNSNNMQKTQAYAKEKGVQWVSIISSAPGKQGHVDAGQAAADKMMKSSQADHILLDPDGTVGQMYGAKTTPHMFIIGKDGKLLYQGAIDSVASADPEDVNKADNYVKLALADITEGKKVAKAKTRPYGCSVKY